MSSTIYVGVYVKYALFVSVFKQSICYLCSSLSITVVCLTNSVKPPSIKFRPIDFCQTQVGRCLHSISSEDGDRFNLRNAGYFMNIRREANCIIIRQRPRPLELTRHVWQLSFLFSTHKSYSLLWSFNLRTGVPEFCRKDL